MAYMALYRKFRPKTFEEVRGQEPVVTTLKNQIINNRLSHAYLFCGTRGTGKTTIAKIIAKAANCENPKNGSPCLECASCRAIESGASLNVIEIDAASNNGVDNIRQIIEEVAYSPADGRFKVYIIDEAHMLSGGASNALLKTLEEPPEYVIFILATTEAAKVPITIQSRCQRFDFKRIPLSEIEGRIRELCENEGVTIEDKAVNYIARSADGALRDALSILDRCISFYLGQNLTYDRILAVLGAVDTEIFGKMFRLLAASDTAGALRLFNGIVLDGREIGQFVSDFIWYLRNLLILQVSGGREDSIDVSSQNLLKMKEDASAAPPETVMRYIRNLSDLAADFRGTTQKRVLAEIGLIRMSRPEMETNADSLMDRISKLERMIESGVVYAKGPSAEASAETSGEENASGKKPGYNDEEKKELSKALSGDLKKIASGWDRIYAGLESFDRSYLHGCYPSVGEDDTLLIITDQYAAIQRYTIPEHLEELKKTIDRLTQLDVRIAVRFDDGSNEGGLYPDIREFVDSQIDMEIEEIPDEEENIDEYP
ncbi:MAG: DNA polymerase III subunit gamma/tau, partial [Lachnospiraceae bacterium]|nr:DNA polymerase III subunit gamma/tau [Lachnospiraceae bacterium]